MTGREKNPFGGDWVFVEGLDPKWAPPHGFHILYLPRRQRPVSAFEQFRFALYCPVKTDKPTRNI